MEGLVRLVAESLERHGMTVPPPRIDWSPWTPVDPNLCLTAPCHPGLFIIAEQMVPHTVTANPAIELVILKVGQTQDLGIEMARLCYHSALYDRINTGRCVVRFAVVDSDAQRASAWSELLTNSLGTFVDQTQDFHTEPVLSSSVNQPKRPASLPSGF
jgi:hypothetical protein